MHCIKIGNGRVPAVLCKGLVRGRQFYGFISLGSEAAQKERGRQPGPPRVVMANVKLGPIQRASTLIQLARPTRYEGHPRSDRRPRA